ncbi:MAG TPA: hypothetical protein VFV86_10720, partial [Nitrososphaeraceae archaeon]|nr:hypothetical protein [Nitrososphaeraceae archaeon]
RIPLPALQTWVLPISLYIKKSNFDYRISKAIPPVNCVKIPQNYLLTWKEKEKNGRSKIILLKKKLEIKDIYSEKGFKDELL